MFSSFIGVFAVECFHIEKMKLPAEAGMGFIFFMSFYVCDFILSVLVPTDVRSDNVPLFS